MKKKYLIFVALSVVFYLAGFGLFACIMMATQGGAGMQRAYFAYLLWIPAAIFAAIGGIMRRKERKRRTEVKDAPRADGSAITVPPIPEDAVMLGEADGRNLHALVSQGENLEKLTLADDQNKYVFDFLWYNIYGGVTYCVLGESDSDGEGNRVYTKYIFRIADLEEGTFMCEENDEAMCARVRSDFTEALRRLNAQSGAAGDWTENVQSPQESGQPAVKATLIDRGRIKTFIVLTAVYAVVLAVGLIGYFTGFGIKDVRAAAICRAICVAYALITPSYLVYFGAHNPFGLHKAIKIIFIVVGIAAMVVCACVGLTLDNPDELFTEGFWGFFFNIFQPASHFVAILAFAVAYLLWCRGRNSYFYLGYGIGVTVLYPVATALVILIFVIALLIGIIKWLLSSLGIIMGDTNLFRGLVSGWTGKTFAQTYEITDENGYTQTVKTTDGIHFTDGNGNHYVSDGGDSIRKV